MALFLRSIAAGAACFMAAAAHAEEAAPTSASCFNPGLYRTGSVAAYDLRVSGAFKGEQSERQETGGRTTFNGQDVTEVNFAGKGKGFRYSGSFYVNVTGDYVLNYGSISGSTKQTLTPAEKYPVALEKGAVLRQEVVERFLTKGGDKTVTERKSTTTFEGIETIDLDFGSLAACKFVTKVMERQGGSSTYKTSTDIRWVASGAPYQGLFLRSKYGKYKQTVEITRVKTFDIK